MNLDSLWQSENSDVHGLEMPTREAALTEALQAVAHIIRPNERVWHVAERYDDYLPSWIIDVVRQGNNGRWVRQRFMFDIAAKVLHYRGESALSDDEFRQVRREAKLLAAS
jgi:hypothetical protein